MNNILLIHNNFNKSIDILISICIENNNLKTILRNIIINQPSNWLTV